VERDECAVIAPVKGVRKASVMTWIKGARHSTAPPGWTPRLGRAFRVVVGGVAVVLLASGCSGSSRESTPKSDAVYPCQASGEYATEQARLETSQLVVIGTLRQAENSEGRRNYEMTIEEEIMGAPELAGDVVAFSVPDECDGSPVTVPEFDVGDRVKAYLRSEDPDIILGPLTILSPHDGLQSAES
jgi:hypothetical protein